MSNDYKIVGTHTMRAGVPEDCTECHNAEWGGVLVNGVCGRCLYTAWQAAQQSVQLTGGTLPDFQALFDPEVLSIEEADTTPALRN